MGSTIDQLENPSLQLAEMEMLSSMFPNPGEFQLDDPSALVVIQDCVDEKIPLDQLQSRLGFSVNLNIDNCVKTDIEMVCHLPHEYPTVPPQVFLRAPSLDKSSYRSLCEDLHNIITELDRGEICLGTIIQWLQDNASSYISENEPESADTASTNHSKDDTFTRMWLYSHHIYSKIKRKDILDFSAELQLTGFSMPGKPGIIVIEGYADQVEEFWRRIRSMQWKRLVMKEKETVKIESKDLKELRIFEGFEEKHFEPRQGKGRGAHMDIGLLYSFLEEKGCAHIFPMYFGVEGKGAPEQE